MINHLRTLLLNIDGTNNPGPIYPGEVYVPPTFKAKQIPTVLRGVYYALLPPQADRALKNMRLWQAFQALHSGELEEYVLALDPRVTYLPFGHSFFSALVPIAKVKQLAGPTKTLYVSGTGQTLETQGRIRHQWRVEILDATNVRIRQFNDEIQIVQEQTSTYTTTSGLSSKLFLPPTSLSIQFETGVGSVWQVDALGRSIQGIPQVVEQLEQILSAEATKALFGGLADKTQPYATCRNLWQTNDLLPRRFAAAVLALGYRLHEVP